MGYEHTRQRHVAYLASILPQQIARVTWPAEKLAEERQRGLRRLLSLARERSRWHRERLRGADPDHFSEQDLHSIPPMTKAQLMASWDDIVTDRRLTLARAQAHVAGLGCDAYLLGDLHAVASGGSSGLRGVFAFGWEAWALAYVGLTRMLFWDRSITPELAALPNTLAVVGAQNASHMTAAMGQTFASPQAVVAGFPVTLPPDEIVSGLNAFKPTTLIGYASSLGVLALEARRGRLRIRPKRIVSTAEPLLPNVRAAVEEALGAPIANTWGTSEAGPMGNGCFRSAGMHLCDDLVIVEPVDERGAAVLPGTCSDKILLTVLTNPTLPLIRYEIDDQMTLLREPCACGSAHRRVADVEGRLDDVFRYPGGVVVHPHVFRTLLAREPGLIEYQVRQTARGARILALGQSADQAGTQRALEAELARLRLPDPVVELRSVARLERQVTGKVRRFVPLA